MDKGRNCFTDTSQNKGKSGAASRRQVLKALAGIPVLGAFALAAVRNWRFRHQKTDNFIQELGLEKVSFEKRGGKGKKNRDLLRLGIIGFGSRAKALSSGLGCIHPDKARGKSKSALENWLGQEDLNVAITGICEVFDLRAQLGLETVTNPLHPGGGKHHDLPVRRYGDYRKLLEDKDIDAVVIATPDHWHAQMTIDAIQAGKHVYCEKCITRTEEELYRVYNIVKDSGLVFQLGHQISKNMVFQQAREIIAKGILGNITLVETSSNRNSARGAWIRHLDPDGNPLPGNVHSIDWKQWLGASPYVPFTIDRYYNWTKWFAYGTGMLGQLFSHEFDAVNYLLEIGIPEKVTASGGIYYWKDNREIPDVFQAEFQYPERGLTLTYSGNLANSYQKIRKLMGNEATMELGASLQLYADSGSSRYRKMIEDGMLDPEEPMIILNPLTEGVDAVSSATAQYYASRGLTYTYIEGRKVDVTHLHLAEWLNCIRNGGIPSANIERSFDEGVTIQMAQKSFLEKREVSWDPAGRRII